MRHLTSEINQKNFDAANSGDAQVKCQKVAGSVLDNFERSSSSQETCRQTPSPSDSGLELDLSPGSCNALQVENSTVETITSSDSGLESDLSPSKCNVLQVENSTVEVDQNLEVNVDQSDSNISENTVCKPNSSYVALISQAILSSPEQRMVVSEIYQHIMDNYEYYNNQKQSWRNSIRHNLSLNECFVKVGRAHNGKGNYWAIHPTCLGGFAKGDFCRREARRRANKIQTDVRAEAMKNTFQYSTGYVPMTATRISYHPYSAPVSTFRYQQPPACPTMMQVQTTPSNQLPSSSYNTGYQPTVLQNSQYAPSHINGPTVAIQFSTSSSTSISQRQVQTTPSTQLPSSSLNTDFQSTALHFSQYVP